MGQIETERQLLDIYVETEEITRAEFDRKMAVLAELERFVDANAAALAAELEAQRQAEQATAVFCVSLLDSALSATSLGKTCILR